MGEWHWNMYNIIYETSHQSRFDARYWMLGAGALGRPKGMVWGGRREEGSGWGTRVYLWQIHVDIWKNQYNIVKLKNKIIKKRNALYLIIIYSIIYSFKMSQKLFPFSFLKYLLDSFIYSLCSMVYYISIHLYIYKSILDIWKMDFKETNGNILIAIQVMVDGGLYWKINKNGAK